MEAAFAKARSAPAKAAKTGVVLMTYGSATTADGVATYFESIHPGRVSAELVQEFERRYALIGRSPLIDITKAQAAALETTLNGDLGSGTDRPAASGGAGGTYVVRAGMRHSAPSIGSAVAECAAAGATSLVGIILSPQFSSFIMDGYRAAFVAAAKQSGFADGAVTIAGPWPTQPEFVELLATRIRSALAKTNAGRAAAGGATVIFSTHSLPQRVVERDPSYLTQLEATINAVRTKLDSAQKWRAGYQSAGHSPEEWLKPDLTDILAELRDAGEGDILIVPIQFLADHLEILYDLDIAAKAQCEECGIAYHRIELPNADPLFISALASLARAALPGTPS